ncbi:MAG: hypothetical protein CJBNEKGG_03589 [Prosthecobacter sp.]|nr:hypothetical protein [Prosthecobacter sp.]
MITLTINPRTGEDVYSLLTQKEKSLRGGRTTLVRHGPKRKDKEKWVHSTYKGWIQFQRCLGGVVVAQVKSRDPESTWQLLSAFIGYINRHFRTQITGIHLQYGDDE